MSVRVVGRVRPLLKQENARDIIVEACANDGDVNTIRIPNPKNETESYSFQFNSVYGSEATQQELFDREVAPTIKQLFGGLDLTLFAYGVTGTGKTHTMRGGKSLADRGVIPRLLSAVYRRAKKIERDSAGDTTVEVAMSYYEIYNDRVFDLFEPPEKRTPAGLPIRDNGGKTVVVGLTERPCSSLKEFEQLYDQANVNRSTSATKLNAHSSRSHAILGVRITQSTQSTQTTLVSSASAIDLAGSEDNRRTENNKDRLVESAAINKSLFVLAQCVEAISKNASRIPYRESKMTRILSLGQNQGVTVMILNLAPLRSYHLDTLSSLNFANRTKKIEVNEIENMPIYSYQSAPSGINRPALTGTTINRQPLRPLVSTTHNISLPDAPERRKDTNNKPVKAFSVYADPRKPVSSARAPIASRESNASFTSSHRPAKPLRPTATTSHRPTANPGISAASIEAMIDRKLDAKLAERALRAVDAPTAALPDSMQARLDALEQRVAEKEDSDGLHFLLMAKQHAARGEETSALRMYRLALPYYPGNQKLVAKIKAVEEKIKRRKEDETGAKAPVSSTCSGLTSMSLSKKRSANEDREDGDYQEERSEDQLAHDDDEEYGSDEGFHFKTKARKPAASKKQKLSIFRDSSSGTVGEQTPRTRQLINIINTRDVSQIKTLKGVGAKKAEAIVGCLVDMADDEIVDLEQLGGLKGVGWKGVENMRAGLMV